MAKGRIGLTIVLAMALGMGTAGGKTVYVDNKGSDDANGLSWATAFKTINKGIKGTVNGDTVEVNEGKYTENLVFCNDSYLYAGPDISPCVKSKDPNDWHVVAATIIDGNGAGIVVRLCMGTTAQFCGFTVTGGEMGIKTEQGATPVISNCIVRGNKKAGVMVYQSTTNIKDCIIYDNFIQGIMVYSAWCEARNNVIYGNGDGITIDGHPNTTGFFENDTIVDNNNCGIRRIGDPEVHITNCIIWDNNDELSGDANATYSCVKNKSDANGTGNITGDPLFVNPGKRDYHISAKSPCVNAGDPKGKYAGQVDIDGKPRVMDGRVDMGADEVNVAEANAAGELRQKCPEIKSEALPN